MVFAGAAVAPNTVAATAVAAATAVYADFKLCVNAECVGYCIDINNTIDTTFGQST